MPVRFCSLRYDLAKIEIRNFQPSHFVQLKQSSELAIQRMGLCSRTRSEFCPVAALLEGADKTHSATLTAISLNAKISGR